MIIFIQNIPGPLSREELENFVAEGLRRVRTFPYFAKGTLEKCDVLRIKAKDQVEYHGLAFIDGERAAKAHIRYLPGSTLAGRKVVVRQYHQRAEQGDRRVLPPNREDLAIVDRRRGDRRRRNLQIEALYGHDFPSTSTA